jgi:hypothetical protein
VPTSPPKTTNPDSARLYVIIARNVRSAIVFRRGPVRKVRLLNWNLETDKLTPGQWFFGRVYERRCDLSPDGRLLAYFAGNHRKPFGTWTAISRPPYFTALALWPKGDTWGGGALFDSARSLQLNHIAMHRKLAPIKDTSVPSDLTVAGLSPITGWGEDDPIMSIRLVRDGWTVQRQTWKRGTSKEISYVFDPPGERTRQLSRGHKKPFTLRVLLHGLHEQGGRWNVETADLSDAAGQTVRDFGRIDWIDADHNGDILLARDGKLERLARKHFATSTPPRVIADLNAMTFEPMVAPDWARSWTAKARK